MTTPRILITTLLALAAWAFSGCADTCQQTVTRTVYEPVYMSYSEMRAATSVGVESIRAMKNPGKIYYKDNLVYINERNEGIHIIDNSNPSAPRKLSFLRIPGNYDMAVRGNTLYADSYVDLLAFDVTDVFNPQLLTRTENAFPYPASINNVQMSPANGVVKYWKAVTKTEKVDCRRGGFLNDMAFSSPQPSTSSGISAGTSANGIEFNNVSNGIGGSLAKFTLVDQYLFTVQNNQIIPFDLANASSPKRLSQVTVNGNNGTVVTIETIFPYEDKLFLGAPNGMYIYNISNPLAPTYISMYQHVTSCDPVVVEGNRAFVTLRTGSECSMGVNELDVVDLSNIYNPTMIASYPMYNPHGLGIRNNTLFICDGEAGLKIFNATNSQEITANLIKQYNDIQATDVIPLSNNILLLIGADGFYQFDYSDLQNIKQLSVLPIE